jgi:WD40 repeat protein
LHELEGKTGCPNGVAFSLDGTVLASALDETRVRLWRVEDGTPLHTLDGHTGCLQSLVFALDGKLLASASWDGTVRLWGIEP